MNENERLISQAVDCLTVVVEDETEAWSIREWCGLARDAAVNALLDGRQGRDVA